MSSELVLTFDLSEGRNADGRFAAQALYQWIETISVAALELAPGDPVKVELVGCELGSLKFRSVLKFADAAISPMVEGAAEYPNLRAVAIGIAALVGPVTADRMIPDQPVVAALSPEDRALLLPMIDQIAQSQAVQDQSQRFYRETEKDPAITGVGINQGGGDRLAYVPRAEFPDRSGLWGSETLPAPERTITDQWSVVLVRAPFVHVPRSWTFSRDGVVFPARMEDPVFLAAVQAGTIPIRLQEGVNMVIEVEYRERLEGQVWEYVDSTRKVKRVLSPLPSVSPFPLSGPPKEN